MPAVFGVPNGERRYAVVNVLGGSVGLPQTAAESVVPGCMLSITAWRAYPLVTVNCWFSMYWSGQFKACTIRLRRDNVNGALLGAFALVDAGDSAAGHQTQIQALFWDQTPGSGIYVLTYQPNSASSAIYTDTRTMSVDGNH
jgi:hypothetical protein